MSKAAPTPDKAAIITWVAGLATDAPELAEVAAIRSGTSMHTNPAYEPLLTLAEASREVRKCPSWLHRLGVQAACGERVAGRFFYRRSRVLAFLAGPECAARIAEIKVEKQRRAAA